MLRIQAEQAQRHAECIVLIALSHQQGLALSLPQNRDNQFPDGGLSITAEYGNYRQLETLSPGGRQSAQSGKRVFRNQKR